MTHAHLKQHEVNRIKELLDEIEEISHKNNEDTQDVICPLVSIFKHEIERIVVEQEDRIIRKRMH